MTTTEGTAHQILTARVARVMQSPSVIDAATMARLRAEAAVYVGRVDGRGVYAVRRPAGWSSVIDDTTMLPAETYDSGLHTEAGGAVRRALATMGAEAMDGRTVEYAAEIA